MPPDLTFPLALCKAQWSIGLRMLAWLETCGAQGLVLGAHLLDDRSEKNRADAEAVSGAADWATLTAGVFGRAAALPVSARADAPRSRAGSVAAVHAAGSAPPRQHAVDDALHTLHRALNPPPRRARRAGGIVRAKA